MGKISSKTAIHTALISAFTLTAALLWGDAIIAAIKQFVPPQNLLFYEFVVAIIATLLLILAIYLIFKTESEVEHISLIIKKRRKKKKK